MAQDIVGSKMSRFASEQLQSTSKGYGQNGASHATSDLPGQATQSGFLPQCDAAQAAAATIGGKDGLYAGGRTGKPAPRAASRGGTILGPQTRDVGVSDIKPAFGMRSRNGEV